MRPTLLLFVSLAAACTPHDEGAAPSSGGLPAQPNPSGAGALDLSASCDGLLAQRERILRQSTCTAGVDCVDQRFAGYTKATYCGDVRVNRADVPKAQALDRAMLSANCGMTAYASCPPPMPRPKP